MAKADEQFVAVVTGQESHLRHIALERIKSARQMLDLAESYLDGSRGYLPHNVYEFSEMYDSKTARMVHDALKCMELVKLHKTYRANEAQEVGR